MTSHLDADVKSFRRFNRMYTKLLGTLDEGMHRTPFSLAEARTLYELATTPDPNAKQIAEALAMDPGYLSRILTKLEALRLMQRKASRQDNRRADLALTPQGRKAFEKLDTRSNQQARSILDGLSLAGRTQLIRATQTIEDILAPSAPPGPPFVLRPHRVGDMGWVVHREGSVYAEEFGWDDTFEGLVARIVADFLLNFDAQRERCWIAEIDRQPVGHIFLVQHPEQPGTAKLRLLFVEPSARGKSLGHALVNECVQFARATGYSKITLWTQSILVSARRIYDAAGFQLVDEKPHHSFGKDLVGQTLELQLTPPSTKPATRRRTKPPRA